MVTIVFCFILAALAVAIYLMLEGTIRPTIEKASALINELPYSDDMAPPSETVPSTLRVLSYNIHFGIGRDDDHSRLDKAGVREILDGIADFIRKMRPDILLLQEVDFDSQRSHHIDQMQVIAEGAGLPYMASVVTWKKRYVPYPYWPPNKHFGKVHSGQVVLSRFPILDNTSIRLPKPSANPFWYNAFYLDRVLQHVIVDVAGTALDVFNVHTEAFDRPTRQLHAQIVRDYVRKNAAVRNGKGRVILAGDFNAVPPEATIKDGFEDEPDCDMREDKSVATIRELDYGEMIPIALYEMEEELSFTFPSDMPNRRLDYIYHSLDFNLLQGRVLTDAGLLSDHLPIFAELAFPKEKI